MCWEQLASMTYASFQSWGFSKILADGPVFMAAQIGCSCQYEPTPVPKTNLFGEDSCTRFFQFDDSLPEFSVELLFHISPKVGSCAHSFKTFMLITLFIHVLHDLFWNKGIPLTLGKAHWSICWSILTTWKECEKIYHNWHLSLFLVHFQLLFVKLSRF